MITEQGTIKASAQMDGSMQSELNNKPFIFSIVLMVIGGTGVFVSLIMDIVAVFRDKSDSAIFIILIVFAVLLGLGIGLFIIVRKSAKTATSSGKINDYEFLLDYFTVKETYNGEEVGYAKVYNHQITKARETKNFLFFYVSAAAAYPVSKDGLTEAELSQLRKIFGLPQKSAQTRKV